MVLPRWYLIVSMPDLCILHYFYNAGKLTDSFQQLDEYFLFLNKFLKTFTAFVTNIIQIQFILQILKKVTLDTIKKNVVQKR